MRENKVIYGLIGYGGMGRWHTEILSNVPEIEIGGDRKSTRLNSSHVALSRMPSSA